MEKQFRVSNYEYWGGIECTLNRVNDEYFDQLSFTGHYTRGPQDIERIASLGITKLRFPILWESHEPRLGESINWQWTAEQLQALHLNNVTPIAGLVHHGSGPSFTNLADPDFAKGLANFAAKVARQFPWLEYYTPVNEPLTTARFSGLYGVWYPHKRDSLAFLRMLLNELRAIVLAMRAIRQVNSDAKLVQTEDLSKTYSTPRLQYQVDFENERRWLTYDFLCGKVNRQHNLWGYLRWVGLTEHELLFFEENPCIPDIAGFNYYLTSERFLDEEIDYYPAHMHGGNGRDRYVDTEAIRVDHPYPSGLSVLLQEAWERYKLPMALTEVFLSCTEDEQVRWVYDVCKQCDALKSQGIDLRAVTFWALLGEFGWNKLVTSLDGEYECGAFDVREAEVKETLLGSYIKALTSGKRFNTEWMEEKGWWRHDERFHYKAPCNV